MMNDFEFESIPSLNRDEYLMLSGIQHYSFCKRQWALIHLEQVWSDNTLTYGGSKMHEKADNPYIVESRGTYFISRGMPVYSDKLRLYGICDVVEFLKVEAGGVEINGKQGLYEISPVEYKYGKEKYDDIDIVQLIAQSICIEEMFETKVKKAFLYYGKTRSRIEIKIDDEMRAKVLLISQEMNLAFENAVTPKAIFKPHCKSCSLLDLCNPKICGKTNDVNKYMKSFIDQEVGDLL